MAKAELRNLPPAERIRKLKELEKKRQREIEEAHKLIRESEQELTEERKWREKVPIPEVAKEELEGLSEEGKIVLKVHRGIRERKKEQEAAAETKGEEESEGSRAAGEQRGRAGSAAVQRGRAVSALEESLAGERAELPPEARGVEYGILTGRPLDVDYTLRLSQRPAEELYKEIAGINRQAEEKGYLSREEVRRIEYITGAVQEKIKAAEEGTYSFTEQVARAASLTQQIGMQLRDVYKRGGIEAREKDWYSGR